MAVSLQKLTTEFVLEEDRLRITGLLSDGQAAAIWLTARLLHRMVPALCSWLERQAQAHTSASATASAQVLLQRFAQEAACQPGPGVQQRQQQPATVLRVVRHMLVHSVTVHATPQHLQLVLQAPSEPALQIGLAPSELRQWLSIVYGLYQQAQWPLHVWPQWMQANPQNVGARSPTEMLH